MAGSVLLPLSQIQKQGPLTNLSWAFDSAGGPVILGAVCRLWLLRWHAQLTLFCCKDRWQTDDRWRMYETVQEILA